MRHRWAILMGLIPLLAACGGSGSGNPGIKSAGSRPAPITRAPVRRLPGAPQVQMVPGLEGVIGATAADLSRQFGPARLDVWEGDAHKLQFNGPACVLDIYLYPASQGREPQATYVDARRTDGRDVDRAACVSALRRR